MRKMELTKYHALGNDYLIVEEKKWGDRLTASAVRAICNRHKGIGADGVLVHHSEKLQKSFHLKIINPDGSEAEKSGNGLRIYAKYLRDRKLVSDAPFDVVTHGGVVRCQVNQAQNLVTVEMGRVSFHSNDIPVAGHPREVIGERIEVNGRTLEYCAVTIGNPHCIVTSPVIDEMEAKILGPQLETDHRFPNRTNVQFLQTIDATNIRIEIWERGAGYTLASGTSSCAAAAVAHRLGLCGPRVNVHMPGGALAVQLSPEFDVTIAGSATRIADCRLTQEWLDNNG